MWGAEHLHGDEMAWGQIPVEVSLCDGCYAESDELQRVYVARFDSFDRCADIGRYCPDCRENMTCIRCAEYDESVDRQEGKIICLCCLEEQ